MRKKKKNFFFLCQNPFSTAKACKSTERGMVQRQMLLKCAKKKNLDCQFKVGVQNKAIQTKSKGAKILSKWQSCH
jgi:hypothetical protein